MFLYLTILYLTIIFIFQYLTRSLSLSLSLPEQFVFFQFQASRCLYISHNVSPHRQSTAQLSRVTNPKVRIIDFTLKVEMLCRLVHLELN